MAKPLTMYNLIYANKQAKNQTTNLPKKNEDRKKGKGQV
jgi:hypothetical protein